MVTKKHFSNVIDGILGNEENPEPEKSTPRKQGRPKKEDYERRTFQIKKGLFCKIKLIAAREGILQKDILEYALEYVIGKYEKKNGEIEAPINKGKVEELFG